MESQAFRIVCGENRNDIVDVEDTKAATLIKESDYFRAMFEHGTVESGTKTIVKPEWTKETTHHIVELICSGSTRAKTGLEVRDLVEASKEILLDLEVFGSSEIISSAPEDAIWMSQRQWELVWNHKKPVLRLGTNRQSVKTTWVTAKESGILMMPNNGIEICWKGKHSEVSDENTESSTILEVDRLSRMFAHFDRFVQDTDDSSTNFWIHYDGTDVVSSVFSIAQILRNPSTDKKVFHEQGISLRFSSPLFLCEIWDKLFPVLKERTSVNAFVHKGNTPGYYLDRDPIATYAPTFVGNFQSLYKVITALENINEFVKKIDQFSLRLTAPSKSCLQNFMDATSYCEKNPSTLGVDVDSNAYFAVKNRNDMVLMLKALSQSTPCTKKDGTGPFQLSVLENPEGTF